MLPGLQRVTFSSAVIGWATTSTALWRSSDGGQHWQEIAKLTAPVRYMGFMDDRHGWLRQNGSYIMTTDEGKTFQPLVSSCGPADQEPNGPISFINTQTGWALCPIIGIPGKRPNMLYRTDDGGKHWQKLIGYDLYEREPGLPQFGFAIDLIFLNQQQGWIVIDNVLYGDGTHRSVMRHTEDGGYTWKRMPKLPAGTTRQVAFVDALQGYIIVEHNGQAILYGTWDGGATWEELYQVSQW